MQTKVGLFCEKVVEAGWLAAAIVVPLFFNIYSSRVFEPDKISLLRSIAMVALFAWVIKVIEGGMRFDKERFFSFLRLPLVTPALALAGVYLLTTATSIVPRISLWGSYQRLQGAYTTLSYLVIFLLILLNLRTRRQLDRLVTVMIFTSLPIALYGVVQHFKLDPLPWAGDVTFRVASTMGNSIFVAAYLIMVVPLTMGRFLDSLQPSSGEGGEASSGLAQARGYLPLLLLQGLSLLYLFAYQIFFLSDIEYVAGGIGFSLLLFSIALFALSTLLLARLESRRGGMPVVFQTISRLFLFSAQGLSLLYSLLLVFKLNYLVAQGEMVAEFVALFGAMSIFVVSFWFTFREEALLPHLLGVLYAFLLALQLACVIFTQSRGPLIGLLAGLFAFLFILAVRRRLTWLWLGSLALALIGISFLVILNLPNTLLSPLKEAPYIGRLGRVFETETGTGKVRLLIWEGAVELISSHEPLRLPPDHRDGLNTFRPLIGYGPESMYVAYNRFYPPELGHYEARNRSPDRSHNETFDALVTTGFIGFLAYIFLFSSLFYYGLHWLGFVRSRGQRDLYVALWSLFGLLGAFLPWLVEGCWRFSGGGLAAGVVVGLLAYLVVQGFTAQGETGSERDGLLLIALLSAILAHFVEIHFGIAIAATRSYFWIYAGMLMVAGVPLLRGSPAEPLEPSPKGERRRKKGRRQTSPHPLPRDPVRTMAVGWERVAPILPGPLLVALLLITLVFDLITPHFDLAARGFSIPWLFFFSWSLATCFLFAKREWERVSGFAFLVHILISLVFPGVFALSLWRLLHYSPVVASLAEATQAARRAGDIITVYYLTLFFILFLCAWALGRGRGGSLAPSSWRRGVLYLLSLPLLAFFLATTNLNPVRADIIYKQGLEWENRQQWDVSIATYREAIALSPAEDWYHLFLARSLLEKAKGTPQSEGEPAFRPEGMEGFLRLSPEEVARLGRDSLMVAGQVVLERARSLNSYNTDHVANLGRLYNVWGVLTTDPDLRRERLEKSLDYYQEATTLSPHNVLLFNEWGRVYLALGDYQGAIAKFQESWTIDPDYEETYLLLLDAYAAHHHQTALREASEEVKGHIQSGYNYVGQGDLEAGLGEFFRVAELVPSDFGTRCRLTLLLYQMGRKEEAMAQARMARELASPEQTIFLEHLIAYWEGRGG